MKTEAEKELAIVRLEQEIERKDKVIEEKERVIKEKESIIINKNEESKKQFPEKILEMSEKEMGQIALACVRAKVRDGVRITPHLVREIGETAKQSGIDFKRAKVFAEIMTRELLEEAFAEDQK